jgi:hypothetical protein
MAKRGRKSQKRRGGAKRYMLEVLGTKKGVENAMNKLAKIEKEVDVSIMHKKLKKTGF